MTAVPTSVRFTRKVYAQLQQAATAHGTSISDIVQRCVSAALPRLHPLLKEYAEAKLEADKQLFEIEVKMRTPFEEELEDEEPPKEEIVRETNPLEVVRQLWKDGENEAAIEHLERLREDPRYGKRAEEWLKDMKNETAVAEASI